MLTDVRNGKGSLGKFMVDEGAYNRLTSSLAKCGPHHERRAVREGNSGKTGY